MIKKKRELDAMKKAEQTSAEQKKKEDQDKILEDLKTKAETKVIKKKNRMFK